MLEPLGDDATPAARVVVVTLGESPQLLKIFEQHTGAATEPRAVAGKLANGHAHTNGVTNGHAHPRERSTSPDMDVDEELVAPASTSAAGLSHGVVALAVSGDAQWLASVDRARRLHVFSLDSLTVRRHRRARSDVAAPLQPAIATAATDMHRLRAVVARHAHRRPRQQLAARL